MKIFDKNTGDFVLNDLLTLHKNLTIVEVRSAGVNFIQEIDMKTGWVYRTTGPHLIFGHLSKFSLGFKSGLLKNYSFTFLESNSFGSRDLHVVHNQALMNELGSPSMKGDGISFYEFLWGTITSEFDVRGGACNVLVSWGE